MTVALMATAAVALLAFIASRFRRELRPPLLKQPSSFLAALLPVTFWQQCATTLKIVLSYLQTLSPCLGFESACLKIKRLD